MVVFNPLHFHPGNSDPREAPDFHRIARLYGRQLTRLTQDDELSPADVKMLAELERAAHNELRVEHNRQGADEDNITREELVRAFIEGSILHELFFLVPGGHNKFDMITRSKDYYLYEANRKLAKSNPPKIEKGRRYVAFGPGMGRLDAELAKQRGKKEDLDIVALDLSKQSHAEFEANMRSVSGSNTTVRCYAEDFLYFEKDGMWSNGFFENEIRAPNDETPISATIYNVLGNVPTPQAMRCLLNFRAKARVGDELDVSFDCTRDRGRILLAYGLDDIKRRTPTKGARRSSAVPPFEEEWFEPGLKFLWETKLGLKGLRWDKIRYTGDVVAEPFDTINLRGEPFDILNLRAFMEVDESHRAPWVSEQLKKFLHGPGKKYAKEFHEKRRHFRGTRHEILSSRRPPLVSLPNMFDICGWNVSAISDRDGLKPRDRLPAGINPVIFRLTPKF